MSLPWTKLEHLWRNSNVALLWGLVFLIAGLIAIATSFVFSDQPSANVFATSGSGLAAAGGIFLALGTFVRGGELETSKFYLEKSIESLRGARELLADGNNDRQTWILAARIIARVQLVSAKISVAAYREIFELEEDVHRSFFAGVLKSDSTGLASFFMGSPNPGENFAAAEERQRQSFDLLSLSPASLKVIFDAAEYPEHYEDALNRNFTPENHRSIGLRYPSLSAYLAHIRENPQMGRIRMRAGNPEDLLDER